MTTALDLLNAPAGPVLHDCSEDAEPGVEPPAPVQASMIAPAPPVSHDAALETAQMQGPPTI